MIVKLFVRRSDTDDYYVLFSLDYNFEWLLRWLEMEDSSLFTRDCVDGSGLCVDLDTELVNRLFKDCLSILLDPYGYVWCHQGKLFPFSVLESGFICEDWIREYCCPLVSWGAVLESLRYQVSKILYSLYVNRVDNLGCCEYRLICEI